jgi:hypothetical protein
MIIISARFVRAPAVINRLYFAINSRMNQVEIQNDNLGPTIDQTEDMHMEKAKEISVQEATFNNYVTTHHEKRLNDLLFMNGLVRKRVPADGNCFFQSALPHMHSLLLEGNDL